MPALPAPPSPQADRAPSVASIAGPGAFYPTALLVQRKEGYAGIDCIVAVDGTPRDCHVVDTFGGDAVAAAALGYIGTSRFLPAIQGGVPVEAPSHTVVSFALQPSKERPRYRDILTARPVAGATLIYPPRMIQSGREGQADISCRILVDGFTKDCAIVNSLGGSAFASTALDYVSHLRFAPELKHGVPVETQHNMTIAFRLNGPESPFRYAPDRNRTPVAETPVGGSALGFPAKMLASGREGEVDVLCVVTAEGATRDCRIVESTGDGDFEAAALDLLAKARFAPATLNGQPIADSHKWTLRYGGV